jgi:hypothetical protein
MQCPRCKFENMPGESRCFKCGSALEIVDATVDVHPPRMAGWKRPVRSFGRRVRFGFGGGKVREPKSERKGETVVDGRVVLGLLLSVVPGLAHLLEGRFREIWLYLLAWVAALCAGVYMYGTTLGFAMLGLAVAGHAIMAFKHRLDGRIHVVGDKVPVLIGLLIVFAFGYWGLRATLFRNYFWGYTTLNIPVKDIQRGDCLLLRRVETGNETFGRGEMVLAELREIMNYRGRSRAMGGSYRMVVQIVAVGGDEVAIESDVFVVNGVRQDPNEYPVPEWLRNRVQVFTIVVPDGQYFIGTEYNANNTQAAYVAAVCLIDEEQIRARAIMNWLPLERRGFLKSEE